MIRASFLSPLAAILAGLVLAGCGAGARIGLSDSKEEAKQLPKPEDLQRDNTPPNRATQVAWTSARAQYCAFNMRPEKLKADYLAYEGQQGLSPQDIAGLTRLYDVTYATFYSQVRELPTYCTRERIEEIRPEINRHLAGDYTPSPKKPPRLEVSLPKEQNFKDEWEKRKADPAQHESPR
ncbi:MAG: hypothetical protein AB7U38_02750 [Hyphomicrobiales bacterium]